MRILLCSMVIVAVTAIAANAEPPPQAAVAAAPAVTVSDAQFAAPAVIVSQVDTVTATSSTATTVVDTGSAPAETREGHGMGFWAVIAVVCLLVIGLGWRYLTRDKYGATDATVSKRDDLPDRTRTPGSSGRGRND